MTNTIEIIIRATDAATRPLREVSREVDQMGRRLQNIGERVTQVGVGLTAMAAPMVLGLREISTQYMEFDRSLTNAASVLGNTREEMIAIREEILALGATSQAGPQAVVESYYDIVSGVADASTHMAILESAIHASEAGAASLGGTTAALISIMNGYGYAADQATYSSDVLTRTVGMGVGTMEEFASALPKTTSLAAQLGVSFEHVGAMTAYLTTKGYTAAESTTALTQSMVALLNPNQAMEAALAGIGAESGSAAIRMYGLAGTFQRLQRASGGSVDSMIEAVGSVEAMRAVLALTGDEFNTFSDTFIGGVEGATDAARAIQMDSLAADTALLSSEIAVLNQEIGSVLEPHLRNAAQRIREVIVEIRQFVRDNPEIVQAVAGIAAGAAVAGPALIGVGTAIKIIGIAVAAVSSPITMVAAALAGLAYAYETNFAGIRDTVQRVVPIIEGWITGLASEVGARLEEIVPVIEEWVGGMREAVEEGVPLITERLGAIWAELQPKLQPLADWFVLDLLPALVDTYENHIRPLIDAFTGLLSDIWTNASPHLASIIDWFVVTGLPTAMNFVTDTVLPTINQFIDLLKAIITEVRPFIDDLTNFMVGAFTTIHDIIQEVIDAIYTLTGMEMPATAESNVLIGGGGPKPRGTARQFGGMVASGGAYMVGEAGPEMFIPASAGRIVPNAALSGDSYVINVMLPAAAMASPGAARLAGEEFGEQIARRLRERG